MKAIKQSLAIAVVLLLVASASVFAAEIEIDGEFNVRFETEYEHSGKIEFGSIERVLNLLTLNVAIEEADVWYVKLNDVVYTVVPSEGIITVNSPEYAARLTTDIIDFDIWGASYDLGSDAVLSDPANLLVLGSHAGMALTREDAAYFGFDPKLRATLKFLDELNAVAQIHNVDFGAVGQTNLELYGDYDLNDYNVGAIVRRVINYDENDDNSTTAVLFASTELSGYQLGASVGNRFGDSVGDDALAFGLTASTDYSEALHLQAAFVQRGADFFESAATSDRLYQIRRFRNTSSTFTEAQGKGSVIELIATYRGEGDRNGSVANYVNEDLFEDRSLNNFIDPLKAAKFASLSAQGIVRIQSDESENAENQLVLRAGFPIVDRLWGAAEIAVAMDKDGVGEIAGVDSEEMASYLAASVLYELNANWDARLSLERLTAHASTNGSITEAIASVSYEVGDMSTTFGYSHATHSDEDEAARQLFAEFEVKF